MLGEIIDRYEIIGEIGAGSTAEVFRARHTMLTETAAVKLLYPHLIRENPEFRERFFLEARAAAGQKHDNIVRIFGAGEYRERAYLVMEFVEGRPVNEIVKMRGRIPEQEALRIILGVARALDYLHTAGIVHCEVKSSNIMIREPSGQPVLMDSVIARAGAPAQGGQEYVSPEQMEGGPISVASDLYSLGIVMYEMLTGALPFAGNTPLAVAMKQMDSPLSSPRDLNPEVSPAAAAVTQRLLEKNPTHRFASGASLARTLEGLLSGAPAPVAPQPPRPDVSRRRSSRPLVPDDVLFDESEPVDRSVRLFGIWLTGILGVMIVIIALILMFRSAPEPVATPKQVNPVREIETDNTDERISKIRPGLPDLPQDEYYNASDDPPHDRIEDDSDSGDEDDEDDWLNDEILEFDEELLEIGDEYGVEYIDENELVPDTDDGNEGALYGPPPVTPHERPGDNADAGESLAVPPPENVTPAPAEPGPGSGKKPDVMEFVDEEDLF